MTPREDAARPIESFEDLVGYFEAGCKPRESWRIGTEHEKFGFHVDTLTAVPYEGERGVCALLSGLADRFGWVPVVEDGVVIALTHPDPRPGGSISLEPGGQFELSGAPLKTIHQTCSEVHHHLDQVRLVGNALGIGFLGLGFSPKWQLEDTPRMPKARYAIMAAHMPRVGRHGLDMMYRSCTVQVNLDFDSEADMVKKLRVGLALQPIATAIFANSPFCDGRPNGYLSYRSQVWRDTDPSRTGMLPFAFEPGMGFERYTDYALDVPMYFVRRDGRYVDVSGASFRDFLSGKLEQLPGERPTLEDWSDHLTTLFPEVRAKRFLEMRGADGGPWHRLCALPAFWAGLLYEQSALEAAWDLVKDWSEEERQELRDAVPKHALATPFRNGTVRDIGRATVEIASQGLKARDRRNAFGDEEGVYLEPVEDIVESGRTQAEEMIESYHGAWKGDVDQVFRWHAY